MKDVTSKGHRYTRRMDAVVSASVRSRRGMACLVETSMEALGLGRQQVDKKIDRLKKGKILSTY